MGAGRSDCAPVPTEQPTIFQVREGMIERALVGAGLAVTHEYGGQVS
jgi:hypothetical protein